MANSIRTVILKYFVVSGILFHGSARNNLWFQSLVLNPIIGLWCKLCASCYSWNSCWRNLVLKIIIQWICRRQATLRIVSNYLDNCGWTTVICVPVGGILFLGRVRYGAKCQYRAMVQTTSDLLLLKYLLKEPGFVSNMPVGVSCNNLAALHICI